MFRNVVAISCLCLCAATASSQSQSIADALAEISANNLELRAHSARIAGLLLEFKTENNLPDPQFGAYYLPIGTHEGGDYTEFQITQSAEFPSVYKARRQWLESKEALLRLSYDSLRQRILLPAQKRCIELVCLNKRLAVEEDRVEQARRVYQQIETSFQEEQIGILEVNKAKVAWLQAQFRRERLERRKQDALLELQHLNGGLPITIEQDEFADNTDLADLTDLWEEQQLADPSLLLLQQGEMVSLRFIELEKQQRLPDLTAGFNYQGVAGSNYAGVFGGVSIPLWSPRHRLEAAESLHLFQQTYSETIRAATYSRLQRRHQSYQDLLTRFQDYRQTLGGLNSEQLLQQAYELGQISYIEYFLELQFYREAYDQLLEMEKDIQQIRAEILQFQL